MIRRPPRSPLFPSTTLSRSGVADHRPHLLVRDAEHLGRHHRHRGARAADIGVALDHGGSRASMAMIDRKSTRLNSSHQIISYAVFCLKKKKNPTHTQTCLRH